MPAAPPLLLQFLASGDVAAAEGVAASPRALRWAAAFDDWLAECKQVYSLGFYQQLIRYWKNLVRECQVMPYDLTPASLQAHVDRMNLAGRAPSSVASMLRAISAFFQWCSQRQIDPQCEPGFNPAAAVARPKIHRSPADKFFTPEERETLFTVLRLDPTPQGKRDYAFYLAYSRLGLPAGLLRRLTWGQIERVDGQVRVSWCPEAAPQPLPAEIWEAICDYLESSGRYAVIEPRDFIFAPAFDSGLGEHCDRPEDWLPRRCLSKAQFNARLKTYAQAAGLPAGKLILKSLCPSPGYNPEPLPGAQPRHGSPASAQVLNYDLTPTALPSDAILAVLAENICGLTEEIRGLRILARGLVHLHIHISRSPQTPSNAAWLSKLLKAHTLAAHRLAGLIHTARQLAEIQSETDDLHAALLQAANDASCTDTDASPGQTRFDRPLDPPEPPALDLDANNMQEEIASARCLLRATLEQALLACDGEDIRRYLHLVGAYSSGCAHLAHLLKAQQVIETVENAGGMEKALFEALIVVNHELRHEGEPLPTQAEIDAQWRQHCREKRRQSRRRK